jgi:hypothetical protein
MNDKLITIFRYLIASLFLLSAVAKLYPEPLYAITKIFEEGQLIPMGFSNELVPYLSRVLIGLEFFLAIAFLQKDYLRKIILPISILLLLVFSFHLSYQVFMGDSENCGCFGKLIPMTPLQALIKNIITLFVLGYLYKHIEENKDNDFSKLSIQFLIILLLIFAFIPVRTTGDNQRVSAFSSYVVSDFDINENRRILCFFDAGCEHCMDAAKSLKTLSNNMSNFPKVHIIFSDSEEEKIPAFFEFVGYKYSYQVLPFYNEDDPVNSYLEILGFEYENPAVIYLENGNQIRFYHGTGNNAFNADELKKILK